MNLKNKTSIFSYFKTKEKYAYDIKEINYYIKILGEDLYNDFLNKFLDDSVFYNNEYVKNRESIINELQK